MLKLNIKIYFFLIVVCAIGPCNKKHDTKRDISTTEQGASNPNGLKTQSSDKDENDLAASLDEQDKESLNLLANQLDDEVNPRLDEQTNKILEPSEGQLGDKVGLKLKQLMKQANMLKDLIKEETNNANKAKLHISLDNTIKEIQKRLEETESKKESPSLSPLPPNLKHQETRSPLPKCVLVTLHGLTMDASELDTIKDGVELEFGKAVEVIQPKSREKLTSARLSIDEQAKRAVEEVKTKLRDRYPEYSEEEYKALPWFIIGHSQGAEVAMMIGYNHGNQLNIGGIISIGGPLTDTDILHRTTPDVNQFYEKAKEGLDAIGHPETSLYEAKVLGTILHNPILKPCINCLAKGVRDMRNTKCSQKIKEFIRNNKDHTGNAHNIPILLIGVYIPNLAKHFHFDRKDEEKVDAFIKAYTKLTTGQEDGEHDLLIPVKRQLCRTNSFENLTISANDPVYPSNVDTYILEDKLHCYNLMSIFSGFTVENGELSVNAEETKAVIREFMKKNLNM